MRSTDLAKFGHKKCLPRHPPSREYLMGPFLSLTTVALLSASSLHKPKHSEIYYFSSMLANTTPPSEISSERCYAYPAALCPRVTTFLNRFQSSVMSFSTCCIYKHSCQLHRRLLFLSPQCVYGKTSVGVTNAICVVLPGFGLFVFDGMNGLCDFVIYFLQFFVNITIIEQYFVWSVFV